MIEDLKKLKISECSNFSHSTIEKVLSAKPEQLLDAMFYLALYNVTALAQPGTDIETRQVLALHQLTEAMEQNVVDVVSLFGREPEEQETIGVVQ